MDLASQKSAQGRTMALESMCTAFNKKFIPEFVEDRRMTITGNLKKKHLKSVEIFQLFLISLQILLKKRLNVENVLNKLQLPN